MAEDEAAAGATLPGSLSGLTRVSRDLGFRETPGHENPARVTRTG